MYIEVFLLGISLGSVLIFVCLAILALAVKADQAGCSGLVTNILFAASDINQL